MVFDAIHRPIHRVAIARKRITECGPERFRRRPPRETNKPRDGVGHLWRSRHRVIRILRKAGKVLDIELLDHVCVGDRLAYLRDVLTRLPAMTNQDDLTALTPAHWQPS